MDLMPFTKLPLFFAPADTNLDLHSGGDLNADKILDELSDDKDADKDVDKDEDSLDLDELDDDKPGKEDDDKEDDEEKKDEDEDDDEDEKKDDDKDEDDDLEDILEVVPGRKEILKAYPDFFKKFPGVEKAIYRDREYSEMLGTPEEAKEVVDRAKQFQAFEGDLFKGDLGTVLSSVKKADEDAFGNIVDNLMPALMKVDANAYHFLLGDIIKRTLISAVNEAANLGEEDKKSLQTAAAVLHQYVFGPGKFTPPTQFGKGGKKEDNTEKTKLDEERAQFTAEKFEEAQSDLSERVDNLLTSTVSSNIDRNGTMSPYVRKTAIREVMETLDKVLAQDSQFQRGKDKLWKRAFEANFSRDTKDAIRRAYLAKAKSVLPQIIKKVRSEALNAHSQKREDNTDTKNKDTNLRPRKEQSPAREKGERSSKSKGVPDGVSTLEFLNSD